MDRLREKQHVFQGWEGWVGFGGWIGWGARDRTVRRVRSQGTYSICTLTALEIKKV